MDKNLNIKQFYYLYKLFPNFNSKIVYMDGFYQIGKEDLLITKVEYDKEILFFTSNNLKNSIYINQVYIDLVKKYDMTIYLHKFIKMYPILQFSHKASMLYLSELNKKIFKICLQEEFEIIEKVENEIQINKEKINLEMKLVNKFTFIQDNKREFRVYSLHKAENAHLNDKYVTTINCGSKKEDIKNSYERFASGGMTTQFIGVIETNSVTSSSNSSQNVSMKEKIKKRIIQRESHKYNRIIIIFNFLGIALSIICLIYENLLNKKLQKYTNLYQVTFNFNQSILGNLINFYILLPTFDLNDPSITFSSIKEYFNELNLPH